VPFIIHGIRAQEVMPGVLPLGEALKIAVQGESNYVY
jgi:hypothetical protein